jgi:hypothetical protein
LHDPCYQLDGILTRLEPWRTHLLRSAPIILVSGTCMNVGKTTVACEIVRALAAKGYRVAASKLAGVATQRDLLNMRAVGAGAGPFLQRCGPSVFRLRPEPTSA